MYFKARAKSEELLILDSLSKRMNLSDQDKLYYLNLTKGYEGELIFDSLTEDLAEEYLILNDLLLSFNKTTFQIDSLMIGLNKAYFYEVKNYEGDFYYESEKIYKKPKTEITNPLNQLSRTETLLRQFIQSLGFSMAVEGYVIFINPEFTLYQAPLNKPFIFPTQIKRHLQQLRFNSSKLNDKHKRLAEKLVSLHIRDSKYTNLPTYEYDQLRKGIKCASCSSFMVTVNGRSCICTECGHAETVAQAVIRNVNEFRMLFPDEKITTNVIHDWCCIVKSKKRIKRILDNHLNMQGNNRWIYYE
ncbi:hypothetical protein MTP04_02150 [Lysinibacillus sp. PLM2]|nr:hypothetical protein MTP04_02150 [Lysinibacillus sp. PLM2]